MLLPRVKAYISRHSLLSRGLALAVGVSGGPDSIVLLHLLTRLRDEFELQLTAVHLDHGLRPESGKDAEFVAQTAKAWGVACVIERVDVGALAKERGLSIEEAGREARYALFAKVSPSVAVAHNADDQAETVLMHFVRGSGMAGLRGMLPLTNYYSQLTIIRPLLDISRADIEAYIAEHNLPFVTDPTNTDRAYFRNRLRHDLLPTLETYNPNIRERLRHTAEVMAGDYELLRGLVEEAWANTVILNEPVLGASEESLRQSLLVPDSVGMSDTIETPQPRLETSREIPRRKNAARNDMIGFHLNKWRSLPLAMQRALLREAVARLKPELRDADFTPIDNAARWSQTATSGHTADLVGGLGVQVVGEELRVGGLENLVGGLSDKRETSNVTLSVPGQAEFLEHILTATLVDKYSLDEVENNPDPNIAYLDAGLGPFTVRTRREGERFQPLGMDGTIKLSDYMINRKLPVDRRDAWPLVCGGESGETVLWVCGYAVAEQGRVREGTRGVVRVEIKTNQ